MLIIYNILVDLIPFSSFLIYDTNPYLIYRVMMFISYMYTMV